MFARQQNDARIMRGLTGNLEATLRAARAAALESASGPEAAKAAAEAAYKACAIAHGGGAPADRPEGSAAGSSKAASDSAERIGQYDKRCGENRTIRCVDKAHSQHCACTCCSRHSPVLQSPHRLLIQISETVAAAAQLASSAGSERSATAASAVTSADGATPVTGPSSAQDTTESASSSADSAASPATPSSKGATASAADMRRRRSSGVEEITPADPPGNAAELAQGRDGGAEPDMIEVFSWKVFSTIIASDGSYLLNMSTCLCLTSDEAHWWNRSRSRA
jgi:hypothetical protein